MSRARKTTGRVSFVGAGPGDPGLLTVRAAEALRSAALILLDPDVPAGVASLAEGAAEVRPAIGDPATVAAALVAEARAGTAVVRLVAGDPLSADAVVREVLGVADTGVPFEVVPGVPVATGVPAYAGVPVGSAHTVVDARDEVDWSGASAAPGTLVLTATQAHLGKIAVALLEQGRPGDTPVSVTADGTGEGQRSVTTTLAALERDSGWLSGPLVVTVGPAVAERGRLSWWESRPLYGWKVLVPRTKEQAGAMSERLRAHGAVPVEVPTIAVEPPRTPAQMERAIKGLVTGRYEWIVFTSTNAVRAVREKFDEFGLDARAFAGVKIACVGESTADAVRAFGIQPELTPSGDAVLGGPAAGLPAVRRGARPDRPGAAAAGRHRHRDAGRRAARARLGDRRRHRVPDRAGGAAAGRDPGRDQVRRLRRGLLHLVLDRAQPGRHRRQAARPDGGRLHRPADRGDGP